MRRYQPPTIDPNPFPHLTDPRSGDLFTPARLAAIHKRLRDELLTRAQSVIQTETEQEIPDFLAVYEGAERFASVCLFDALAVADAQSEVA